MTRIPLRLLLAEDMEDDAVLVLDALARHGYQPEHTRVMTAAAFREALAADEYDIILCDHSMPSFDATEALEILHDAGKDTPLIIVSGTIGESAAVEAMRRGAADYLLKDSLLRLGAAVERELREAESRRRQRLFDRFSHFQSEVQEMILDQVPLPQVLERIARSVIGLSATDVLCSIMLASADGEHLLLGAQEGFPSEFFEKFIPLPIAAGMGPCGTAAAQKGSVVIEDVARYSDSIKFRDEARKHGLRSCWSLPILSADGALLGTIGIFHKQPHSPGEEEIRWAESVAKLAALAITRSRASDAIRSSEALLRIASRTAHIGGWIFDFADSRVTWSDEVCAIHEVPDGSSPAFDEALAFFMPEFRPRIIEVFERCVFDGTPFDEEMKILTARGREVWVRACGEAIYNDDGSVTRIQGSLQDISSRKIAEENVRSDELRYLEQRNALIALNKESPPGSVDIDEAFHKITETTAKTLKVGRVGIWKFNEDRTAIECLDLFKLESGTHSTAPSVTAADYPVYFSALETMDVVVAENALTDRRTREFADGYLIPFGIGALIDVPVSIENQADHILCCDHTGGPRKWTEDEKTFAVAIGGFVSLAIESRARAVAQQESMTTHQRFQSVAAATNDTIWDWDLETDTFWWNDGFANLFGWSAADGGKSVHSWIRQIHPEDRERVVKGICRAIDRGETHWTDEYRFVSNDGSVSYVRDRGQVLRDAEGKGIRMVGGMTDLTASRTADRELARSHRALHMLSSCNEMLIRASDESELLAEACRIAVEIGGYRMAWVGYAQNDERKSVAPMAHAGHEGGFLAEAAISWGCGEEPSGRAIREGETIIVEDLADQPLPPASAGAAARCGFVSAVCLPLTDKERVFGVLTLYGPEPHAVGMDEVKLLRDLANDLSLGISTIRMSRQRRRAEEIVLKVAQAVSRGTGSEFFDLLVRNMVEAMGACGGLIGRYKREADTVEAISYVIDGKMMDPVTYEIAATPCERVLRERTVQTYERGVRELFPEDTYLVEMGIESYVGIPLLDRNGGVTGNMAVFFSTPLEETSLAISMLQIFATRAAAELDRQVADARIREQASLLDKARDAILVRDLDHKVTYWNKSAEGLYGWSAEEAVGRDISKLLYQNSSVFHKAHEHTLLAGEWTGELTQFTKDGRQLIIEARWTLVRDDTGRPVCVFAINSDITEQKKLEQQFLRAQRLESIGTLAGGIAHDLNNILAPITMAVELLKMRGMEEKSGELLEAISGSAKRGASLVGQVLSFARGVEGCRVNVNPKQIVAEIEGILRDTFPRSIELEFAADEDLRPVSGDPTQLHQVLLNLCVNARDAIRGNGRIRVAAGNVYIDEAFAAANLEASTGHHVRFIVEDNGSGMPPEVLDRIFDPFFTTKSVGKGTGLGLSTSLTIVKSHGGFIRTESKPGEGTCFSIYLPAVPENDEFTPAAPPVRIPLGSGKTVLIVDDEDSIRQIAQRTLESFGYRTFIATNGQQAISVYEEYRDEIDVVLTDMMMPVMDGPAAIIRLVDINPDIRIIATSGLPPERDFPVAVRRNVREFLSKPYSAETLLTCLSSALDD